MNKKIVCIFAIIALMLFFDYIDDKDDSDDEQFTVEEIQKNTCFRKKKSNKGTCIHGKGVCYKEQNIYNNHPSMPCSVSTLHENISEYPYKYVNDVGDTNTHQPISTIIDTNTFDGNSFYSIHTPFIVSGRNPDRPRDCM